MHLSLGAAALLVLTRPLTLKGLDLVKPLLLQILPYMLDLVLCMSMARPHVMELLGEAGFRRAKMC